MQRMSMLEAVAAVIAVGALFALLYAAADVLPAAKTSKRATAAKPSAPAQVTTDEWVAAKDPIPFGAEARACTLCGTTKGVTVRAKPSRIGQGILTLCACKACFEKYT